MTRPNYRDFRNSQFLVSSDQQIIHSAKGSTWEDHKYIKRIDGTYYYPDNYEGGRHLPDGEEVTSGNKKTSMEDELYEKLKKSNDKNIGQALRENFDKILKDQLGIDWTRLPKEEVDRMQKSLVDRIEGRIESKDSKMDLSEKDIDNLAKEVIRGNFGNGQERRDLLGENYEEIQKKVNELMKSSTGSIKVSEATSESIEKVDQLAKNATKSVKDSKVHSGVDLNEVLKVYKK